MDYDVLILGGGIIGCAVAYEISKYNLNIAVIEKDYDIADDVALINTAMIYDGVESEDTLTARLERMGNKMMDTITAKFNVPFKRCGSLIIAQTDEEAAMIEKTYNRAIDRGTKDVLILESKYIYEMEPNLNVHIKKGLYSKNTGVICPFDLALAYGEVAFDNGVKFRLEEEVIDIQPISKGFRVVTNKNKFTCKMVINTTPSENYSIVNEKKLEVNNNEGILKYILLDNNDKQKFSHALFMFNAKGERIYTLPTIEGDTVAAVSTKENVSYNEVVDRISKITNGVDNMDVKMFLDWPFFDQPMVIDDSGIDDGLIQIKGKHYGQITMTPAIANIVCESVVSKMQCNLKKDFNDKRRESYKFREMSDEERKSIIGVDEKYGKIICACEKVTEGEIVDAIRRPLGARTVEGVKRRTGAAFGNCQGAHCLNKIVSILARETNKKMTEIVKDSKNSNIVLYRIKEFDSM
ncbi:NAD(P)/FAD-dependent oxidoreductase [Clostridium tagluense]|uniref:NAD(P)/FAD-dependent oxidoreductase n=1 Tax=Clostridium tagluense TaxID=360422 RepID=UPI001C6F2DAA|nr:FAD-dependent oxidoreductase [Clostridium tagluense]MBW9158634.1 FAD-dependent oxidoreductase [Clostridium tagluense]WLC65737.1 FAD-dependent oxidoreductase [Clostridium tagluense]